MAMLVQQVKTYCSTVVRGTVMLNNNRTLLLSFSLSLFMSHGLKDLNCFKSSVKTPVVHNKHVNVTGSNTLKENNPPDGKNFLL